MTMAPLFFVLLSTFALLSSLSSLSLPALASAFLYTQNRGRKPFRNLNMAAREIANDSLVSQLDYRSPSPKDIPLCFEIEAASYPADEGASLTSLEYRQTNAMPYFQCAILDDAIIGFVCSTRCDTFEEESAMTTHTPTGSLLAIHSVVVQEKYRRKGVASAILKHYLQTVEKENVDGTIQSIVLLSKSHLLGFYVNCGFAVNRPSPIVHGKELWYELERKVVRTLPVPGESWFCKTEQFKRPFPQVKPHLEAHKTWVTDLRREGYCIASGYRVDSEGKPGGGGLLFLAAKSYEEALSVVLKDPLVANDCVDWELNGWVGQVGDVQMR
jgi:uncharacterized protein YciI/GNAT superfamily N-acetyltransferase